MIYGNSSKVTITSDKAVNEPVTIVAAGKKNTEKIENVALPYKLKVKHKNLPMEVSISSPSYNFKRFDIQEKLPKVAAWEGVFWGITAVGLLEPAWIALGTKTTDAKKYVCEVTDNLENYSVFAKQYVEEQINRWQIKGEYEKLSEWKERVNENSRREKAAFFLQEAEKAFIQKYGYNKSIHYTLNQYDPENETFLIKTQLGNMLVHVPINQAEDFSNNWERFAKNPTYRILNNHITIAECIFTSASGQAYKYSNQEALSYQQADIAYNFAPIDVDAVESVSANAGVNKQNIFQTQIKLGQSDIDLDIPVIGKKNANTFAVIIGNENYQQEKSVAYAINDAYTFRSYYIKTLGLPEKNVHYITNATLNNMRAEINWLTLVAEAYGKEANILFYYVGHGIPDEASGTSYLLPSDGYGSDIATGYSLSDLYQKLGSSSTNSCIVFLDVCFSGAIRGEGMLASARGVAIKSKRTDPSNHMVVFTAAQGDETAYPYRDKEHGLFTYFLLKKLKETRGDITLGELGQYVKTEVKKISTVENKKPQTPTVLVGAKVDKWEKIKIAD